MSCIGAGYRDRRGVEFALCGRYGVDVLLLHEAQRATCAGCRTVLRRAARRAGLRADAEAVA